MQIFTERQGALVCFWLSVLFVVTGLSYGNHSKVEVVGLGVCADCKENNIETYQAFSGLRVTVDCKSANGHFKTRGAGEVDQNGNFKVFLPHDVVKDGELKEECYAQLHSASAAPCPAHDGMDHSKIVFKSKSGDTDTLGPAGKLKFSSLTCTSVFFWPFFKQPLFPKLHHPHFPFPPKVLAPFPPKFFPKNPPPSPLPIYKAPLPPTVPVYTKPPPFPIVKKPCPPEVKKPLPPPTPIYKPIPPSAPNPRPTPIYKPISSPTPIYKPHPPLTPIYKSLPPPTPPIYKPIPPPTPPTVPIPAPPFFKPLPPFPELPPFKKKPCPPLPKTPPKYFFHHPKFGKWPPMPPFAPHS